MLINNDDNNYKHFPEMCQRSIKLFEKEKPQSKTESTVELQNRLKRRNEENMKNSKKRNCLKKE